MDTYLYWVIQTAVLVGIILYRFKELNVTMKLKEYPVIHDWPRSRIEEDDNEGLGQGHDMVRMTKGWLQDACYAQVCI